MKRANVTKRQYTYKDKTEDRWVVKWIDSKGKRCENSKFRNKRHAEAFANKIDRDIDRGIHEEGGGRKRTFGELWKAWRAHCEQRHKLDDHAGNTLVNYDWAADHILPEFEHRQIGKIVFDDVQAFVYKKRETLSHHSVKNFKDYMVQAFQYAIKNKRWLDSNPARGVKIPGEPPERDIPPFEEVDKLIQILHGPQPAYWNTITWENHKIAFALRTFGGLRGAEIAALRWEKINLPGAMLEISKEDGSFSRVDGLKKPKSKAGARTIPIPQYLYDALLEHGNATGMTGFVIKNQDNPDMCLSSQEVSDMNRKLLRRANLTNGLQRNGKPKVKFTGHDLRHFNVSTLHAMGVNPIAIAKRTGHADPGFNMRKYGHVIEGTEDGLKESVPPIWYQRFARAKPGQPTMIEGVASESGLVIDGTATRLLETVIPQNAEPWIPEAMRLLEGGWRPSDVTRHLGIARATLWVAFKRHGLETPETYRKKWRDRLFAELLDAGYTDKEIARRLNCSEGTVYHWRRTKEEGVPNTRAQFLRLKKGQSAKKLTDEQVREVWDRLEAGESYAAIGKRFSVSHGLISNIKHGRNYAWVAQKLGKIERPQEPDKSLEYQEKTPPSEVAIAEKMRESQLKLL